MSYMRDLLGRRLDSIRVPSVDDVGRHSTGIKQPISTPSGFSWTTHPLVDKMFVDQYGMVSTTLDPSTRKAPAGVTYWVDLATGSDTNSGLTQALPLQRLYTALAKSDVGTVMLKGNGFGLPYYRARGMNATAITKSINIIGYGGECYVTTHDLTGWALTAGTTKTYETARSTVGEVVDMFNGGAGVKLVNVATQALVETTPGSWFTDGTKVFVRPSTARAADTYIWPLLSTVNFRNTGDFTTYIEGVKFFGGTECVRVAGGSATGGVVTLNNVEGHLAANGYNNISVNGCDGVLAYCDSTNSGSDGYGYHILNGKAPRIVEMHCRSTNCGHSSDDQCSTMHDGGKIIRVGGTYRSSTGANVADVNEGTESWNVGCVAEDSGGGYNWKCGNDGGAPKMWLHGCSAKNGRWSVYAHELAQVRIRGTRVERSNVVPTPY